MRRFPSVILKHKYNLHALFICQFPETSQELYAVSLHIHKLILNPNIKIESNEDSHLTSPYSRLLILKRKLAFRLARAFISMNFYLKAKT